MTVDFLAVSVVAVSAVIVAASGSYVFAPVRHSDEEVKRFCRFASLSGHLLPLILIIRGGD